MKIRLDEKEGLDTGEAIEIDSSNLSAAGRVSVTIWNGKEHLSVQLTAERARQAAMALIVACGGGGDAG